MKNITTKNLKVDFKNLCLELRGAEAIYATLVTADLYPHKRGYFRTRHFQYGTFAKAVENECYFITGHRPALTSKKPNTVFKLEEEVILEMHMTDGEVDTLIGNIELELISRYQEILQYDNLPIFTKSILASQAEELNNQWRKLQMNLKIEAQR